MIDRRVFELITSGTPEALTKAVALLRQAEDVGAATPETAAPENFLLCSEKSLEAIGTTEHDAAKVDAALLIQARQCVEHYMRSRPARSGWPSGQLASSHAQLIAWYCASAPW